MTKLRGTVSNGRAIFIWENLDPHDGDTHLYKASFITEERKVETIKETSVTVAARPVEMYIMIQVRRVGVSDKSRTASTYVMASGQ